MEAWHQAVARCEGGVQVWGRWPGAGALAKDGCQAGRLWRRMAAKWPAGIRLLAFSKIWMYIGTMAQSLTDPVVRLASSLEDQIFSFPHQLAGRCPRRVDIGWLHPN